MKKLFFLIAILLLAGAGYFTYEKWVKHADLTAWSFVPSNALIVYESNDILGKYQEIKALSVWENISQFRPLSELENNITQLDSIGGRGTFNNLFKDSESLISFHTITSTDFDLLYVVEIKNISQHTYLSKALAYFRDLGYQSKSRKYLDFTITDIYHPESKTSFSYIFFKNFFIGSFTSFLVEDAIRTISEPNNYSFSETFPELTTVAKLEMDMGNLYINTSRFSSILQAFKSNSSTINIANSSYLDLKLTEDAINLNGFTYAGAKDNFLSIFKDLGGSSFDIAEIIPSSSAWLYHMTFASGKKFGEQFSQYLSSRQPGITSKRKELQSEYDFDVNHIYALLDEEVGLVTLESKSNYQQDNLLILEVTDMGGALNFFNSMTERYAVANDDTVYHELYGETEIRRLPVEEFPALLFGDMAEGFPQGYYLSHRNYLIFSNSIYQLKSLLDNIDEEDVWNKSLKFSRFSERTNAEANFSMYINMPRAWSQLIQNLKPEWKQYFTDHQFAIRNLEYIAIQFSHIDEKFYSNITAYQPSRSTLHNIVNIEAEQALTLSGKIISKPFLVTNHYTRQREILIQDESNNIYLISPEFEVLWSKDIKSLLNSEVFQVDYYKNGKLQYAFTTPDELHIIDRTGSYLPGFPVELPTEGQIQTFNVIDYDNSKKYRFAISDNKENLFLTNKDGQPLQGWNPQKLKRNMKWPLKHLRVTGNDYMIFQLTNGDIHLNKRVGTNYPGSPIETETELTTDFFIKRGDNDQSTRLSTVTSGGELLELNFKGEITRRDQLYKPEAETIFSLVNDITGNGFLIIRNTGRRYEVLDEKGDLLFEKDYFSKKPMVIQYYKLGGGIEWIVFIDVVDQNLYIYDQGGQLITGGPLRGGVPISVLQYEGYYQIYLALDNELSMIRITK